MGDEQERDDRRARHRESAEQPPRHQAGGRVEQAARQAIAARVVAPDHAVDEERRLRERRVLRQIDGRRREDAGPGALQAAERVQQVVGADERPVGPDELSTRQRAAVADEGERDKRQPQDDRQPHRRGAACHRLRGGINVRFNGERFVHHSRRQSTDNACVGNGWIRGRHAEHSRGSIGRGTANVTVWRSFHSGVRSGECSSTSPPSRAFSKSIRKHTLPRSSSCTAFFSRALARRTPVRRETCARTTC